MEKIKQYLPFIALVLSLVIAFSVFLNVLSTDDSEIMTGTTAIFGGQIGSFGSFAGAELKFNFYNFTAFFLPVIVSMIWFLIDNSHKSGSTASLFFGVISSVVFILSVILVFMLPENTVAFFDIFGFEGQATYEGAFLGLGSIIAYVAGMFGAITSILYSAIEIKNG